MRTRRGQHRNAHAIDARDELGGTQHSNLIGLALAALGAVAFGTLAIFAKLAFERGADSIPLLASRFATAAVLLLVFHVSTGRSFGLRSQALRMMALGGIGYAFESTLFFIALQHAPAAVVGLVFYSYPLWTTLLALAVGLERYRHRIALALATGTAGVSLIFSLRSSDITGPLLALGAAVAVAVYLIAVQKASAGMDVFNVALWTATGAAISLSVVAVGMQGSLPRAALPFAGALGLVTAIAFVALYGSINRIGSSRSSIAMMLEPVTTVTLAAIFLSEVLTTRMVLGAVLVVAALPLVASAPARPLTQERIDLL
ncbi:MAG: DMT family transporter [Actinomycetota bacterium]|nr:DMT family transporter [Actinomycetota bacterium]